MTNGHIIVIGRPGELLTPDNLLGHQEARQVVLLAIVTERNTSLHHFPEPMLKWKYKHCIYV